MSTIVVGYDDTPGSQLALERAAILATALGSKLVVLSVTPVMVSTGRSGGSSQPTHPPEKHATELEAARAYLEAQGIKNADYEAAVGEAAEASVSDAVSHHAHCDVLIVHPPHE